MPLERADRPIGDYQLTIMLDTGMPGEESWVKCAVPRAALSLDFADLSRRYLEPAVTAVIQQALRKVDDAKIS